jgi:carbonic anhydrase
VIDDDSIRSLVISTRLLGSREIMIVNHTDCGMLKFTDSEMLDRLRREAGRPPIAPARFYSFTDVEENTREQIQKARSHPRISQDVPVRGFIRPTPCIRRTSPATAGLVRAFLGRHEPCGNAVKITCVRSGHN